jgi:hypothetical protein
MNRRPSLLESFTWSFFIGAALCVIVYAVSVCLD